MVNRLLQLSREVRDNPQDPRLWIDMAGVRLSMGERDEAIKALESAKRCADAHPDVWISLGRKFADVRLYAQAREILARACARFPESAEAAHRLGEVLSADERLNEGATVMATAVWIAPQEPSYRVGLARTLLRAKALAEAETHLKIVLDQAPNTAEAWLLQADIDLARHDPPAATAALERAFALQHRDRSIGLRLADLLRQAARHQRAVEVLRAVAGSAPEDGEVLTALALAQEASGDRASGIRTLEMVIDLGGAGVEVHKHLGVMYKAAGRIDESIEPLQYAVEKAPEDSDAHYHLGEALLAIGEPGQAVSVLVKGAMLAQDDRRLRALLQAASQAQAGDAGQSMDMSLTSLGLGAPRPSDLAFSGDLAQFGLVDLLEFLRLNRRTGVLQIVSTHGMGELYLVDGRFVGANTSSSERLGDLLVKGGMLAIDDYDDIIGQQGEGTPMALSRAVLDRKLLKVAELRSILFQQAQEAIAQIMGWEDGYFAFQSDDALKGSIGQHAELELDTSSVMLEVLRLMDERKAERNEG